MRRWILLTLVVGLFFLSLYFFPDLVEWQHRRTLRQMSRSQLEAAARSKPSDASVRYLLGLRLAEEGQQLEATREFLAALELEPGRPDVLNDLGVSYLLQERYRESDIAFNGALAARPHYDRAKANLGRLRLATRMPFSAIREFQTALRWNRNDATNWTDLGQAYLEVQKYTEAEHAFSEALSAAPHFIQAMIGLGQTYTSTGRWVEAERELRQAVTLSKNDPQALAALGHTLVESGSPDLDQTAALLSAAAAALPTSAEVRFDLGRTLVGQRKLIEGQQALETAIRLSPEHVGAMTQLQRALRLQGKDAEAEHWAQRLRETSFRLREVRRLEARVVRADARMEDRARLAELYVEQGRFNLASMMLREIQVRDPRYPALARIGRLLVTTAAKRPGAASSSKSAAVGETHP